MTQMRAVLVKNGAGNADALYIGEAERPKPGEGQVLVKVRTSPLLLVPCSEMAAHIS